MAFSIVLTNIWLNLMSVLTMQGELSIIEIDGCSEKLHT